MEAEFVGVGPAFFVVSFQANQKFTFAGLAIDKKVGMVAVRVLECGFTIADLCRWIGQGVVFRLPSVHVLTKILKRVVTG